MLFVLLILCAVNIDGAKEGESCTHNDITGVCVEVGKCVELIEHPVFRKFAPACQSRGSVDVVCCNAEKDQEEACEPLPEVLTASKTGRKAWDKCIDYQQLVFPCRDGVRERLCPHDGVVNQIGTHTHAKRHEFPHAVLLGYTNDKNRLDWLCAGTLVSERFVLTAAHCVSSKISGPVTYVAIHPTDRSDIYPESIYKVKSVIRHPEYQPPRTYHDIALLELELPVPLSHTTVPACLLDGDPADLETPPSVTATTWNTNDVLHTGITWLRKVRLTKYSIDECSRLYPETKRGGYNDTTQLCYGDQAGAGTRDICQDDGGSSLVVESRKVSCMYSVVGVSSYGRGCFAHSPGVYARVSRYLPWIESVVWP